MTTLLRWMRSLPDDVVLARPEYCLDLAWALILTGQIDDAESYLASANQQAGDDRTFLGKVLVAQVHIARTRGQHKQAIELAQAALASCPGRRVGSQHRGFDPRHGASRTRRPGRGGASIDRGPPGGPGIQKPLCGADSAQPAGRHEACARPATPGCGPV